MHLVPPETPTIDLILHTAQRNYPAAVEVLERNTHQVIAELHALEPDQPTRRLFTMLRTTMRIIRPGGKPWIPTRKPSTN